MEEVLSPPKRVLIGPDALEGDLTIPQQPRALVVFAHGSGSSRRSPRNRQVAQALQEQSLATLLFDLLSTDEADDPSKVFDIESLGQRLVATIDWIDRRPALAALPLALFGASTGAAAALVAAAARPRRVYAVVSRGGRPDLAGSALAGVKAPTLLIVGGADTEVLKLNRLALKELRARAELSTIPRATHLFEEYGALQRVTDLASQWFIAHLPPSPTAKGASHA
ncbi:MAG TPA: alpha/beta family hydrolase [Ideonella sp.]|uniref:dienelactone hydrolase family protein n=1 Tax=Ideonella sp. TaxID=1929293 RepID=UPI002E2EDA54|nr:alpha/beta family hydrolase [Ideonella sp.]HEX5685121.1 alpha/beta family hydrolase [Ideonella sp.]